MKDCVSIASSCKSSWSGKDRLAWRRERATGRPAAHSERDVEFNGGGGLLVPPFLAIVTWYNSTARGEGQKSSAALKFFASSGAGGPGFRCSILNEKVLWGTPNV